MVLSGAFVFHCMSPPVRGRGLKQSAQALLATKALMKSALEECLDI